VANLSVDLERHSATGEANLLRLEVNLALAGLRQRATSASASTTGSSPIFVEFM